MIHRLKRIFRPLFYRYYYYFHPVRTIEWFQMRRWLRPQTGEVILDLGCGNGHFMRRLWREKLTLVGIDLSKSGVSIGSRFNRRPGCSYLIGNAQQIPLLPNSADNIVSICAFEHFDDDHAAFCEAYRVLKDNGRFIFSVDSLKYRGIAEAFKESCRIKHFVKRFYNRRMLKYKLESAGFRLCRSRYILHSPLSSFAYKTSCYFKWRKIGFMDPVIFLLTAPLILILESFLGLGYRNKGYILVAEARKAGTRL